MIIRREPEITESLQASINAIHGHIKHLEPKPEDFLFSCTHEDQMIGYLFFMDSRKEVASLYVLEEFRYNKTLKVGFELLSKFKQDALQQDITNISLLIKKDNSRTLQFLTRNGFKTEGPAGNDMIEMYCHLSTQ